MNLQENIQRIKLMMGLIIEDSQPKCKIDVENGLPESIQKWRDWLEHPKTKEKFKSNHSLDDNGLAEIYQKYNSLLDRIKIVAYDMTYQFPDYKDEELVNTAKKFGDAAAFVIRKYPDTIFYNCEGFSTKIVDNLSHEISHLLDYIYPKNSISKVWDLYNDNKIKKKLNMKSLNDFFIKANITDENEKNRIVTKYEKIMGAEKTDKNYYCDEIENIQGVQKLRDELGKQPGENITLQELVPVLTFQNENFDDDLKKFAACWVLKGLPEVNSYINKLNGFVKINQSKNSNFV